MKLVWAIALVVTSLAAGEGCSGHRARAPGLWSRPETSVRITNQNWMDVTVFVVRGVTRSRLGFVNAMTEVTLPLFAQMPPDGSLQLQVDPVGSDNAYTTEAIVVGPGTRVELTVMPSLGMSYLSVRPR